MKNRIRHDSRTCFRNACRRRLQSKQAKVKRLEAEYDKLNAQYRIDCLGMGGSNAQGVNDGFWELRRNPPRLQQ